MAATIEERDFQRFLVPELRKFLTERGIQSTGKRKKELVKLCLQAQNLYSPLDSCDHKESEKKRRRVTQCDGHVIDLNRAKVTWNSNLQNLPKFHLGDVFGYLVSQCEWSAQRLSSFQMDDGYLMFKDRHVERVEIGQITGHAEFVYIQGTVKPEQRQGAERYKTWILHSSKTGIKSAGCGCVAADDGSCKHVVALLFSLVDFSERQTDKSTISCTDSVCQWSQARRESQPVTVTRLDFRKDKKLEPCPTPVPEYFKPIPNLQNDDILAVREKIRNLAHSVFPTAMLLTCLDPPPVNNLPTSIRTLAATYRQTERSVTFPVYCGINTPREHILYMAHLSQEDPAWKTVREGRITASLAGDLRRLKPSSKGKSLIDRILGKTRFLSVPAVEHGRTFEKVARQMYVQQESASHKKLCVEERGLFVDSEFPILGASPDGIIMCKCHVKRGLEIKCSFKHRYIRPSHIPDVDSSYHFDKCGDQLKLKLTSPWYFQVQYQMGVMKVDSCDFVIHTFKGIEVLKIDYDCNVWNMLKDKALEFYGNSIFPLL